MMNVAYAIRLEAGFQQKLGAKVEVLNSRKVRARNSTARRPIWVSSPYSKSPENWRKWWYKTFFMKRRDVKGMCV